MKKTIIHGCESRGDGDLPYLTRYTLIETRWFQLCVHVFHRSDAEEHHDHPWNFITIPIWRGYMEETEEIDYFTRMIFPAYEKLDWARNHGLLNVRNRILPFIPYYRPATHRHRVILLNEKSAITIVLMGKRIREWGFFTKAGWQDFKTYFKQNKC